MFIEVHDNGVNTGRYTAPPSEGVIMIINSDNITNVWQHETQGVIIALSDYTTINTVETYTQVRTMLGLA